MKQRCATKLTSVVDGLYPTKMTSPKTQRYYLLTVFTLLLCIFLWLSFKVYNQQTFGFDKSVFLYSHTFESDFVTDLAIAVTFLG